MTDQKLCKCIFIVGLQCAGKSSFIEIAHDNGLCVAEWSDMLRNDLYASTGNRSRRFDNVGQLVAEKGIEYYPNLIYKHLSESGCDKHIVSGARNPQELKYFRSLYSWSKVLWISTNYIARFHRAIMRGRADKRIDLDTFLRDDFHELAGGLAQIASEIVDDILFNDGNYDEYKKEVTAYLRNLSKGDEQ